MFLMVNKSGYKQMRKIGYARVSGTGQSLDRQIAALRAEQCNVIFREKVSGKSTKNRPELEKAIDELGTGDVLVLAEWDRATRSMFDGLDIIQRVAARAALVKVLDRAYLDLTSTIGKGILAFLSALAQDERERILARCTPAGRLLGPKARGSIASRSLPTISKSRPSDAWPPAKAADRSPRRWPCTTLRSRGWLGRPARV